MTADLAGMPFAIVRRGYDRAQVEDRLTKLLTERDGAYTAGQNAAADRERMSRELDTSRGETRAARAELAETRAEVDRLAGQVAELSTIPQTVDGMSDRLQQMVRVAQDEVNDMRARATRGAAQILGMAQAEADEMRESAHLERRTFESDQRSAQEELSARLGETRSQLATLREEADGQRARLDAELAQRRSRDEQALAAELAERREVMLADLATQEKRQRDDAQRIVDAASARARALVADAVGEADRERSQTREQVLRAGDELEELRALQHQVAEQLTGVRSLLDWTLPRITATAGGGSGDADEPLAAVPVADPTAPGGPGAGEVGPPEPSPEPPVALRPGSARFDAPARGGHTPDGQERDAGPVDEPVAVFDPTHRDTPLFGETAAAVDDTGARAGARTDRDPVDRDVAGQDPGDRERGDARGPVAGDGPDPASGGGASGGGARIPQPRHGDQPGTSRPSPVARSGHRASARH